MLRVLRLVLLASVVLTATVAHAQVVATPYLHANFGDVEIRRGGPGLSFGYLGRRLGFELDIDRHQHFYKDNELASIPNPCYPGGSQPCIDDDTDAWIFAANLVAPIPVLDASKWSVYGSTGPGVIHAWIHDAGEYNSDQTNLAINLGAGVIYWPLEWLGLRADLRYFHAFVDEEAHEGGYERDYDFGRVLLGVTFAPFRHLER